MLRVQQRNQQPVAALATIGEVSEYAGDNIVYAISKSSDTANYVLKAVGGIVGGIIDTAHLVVGSAARLVLSEDQIKAIVSEHQKLPHGIKVLANDIADGAILGGVAKLVATPAKWGTK